jgi:methionyl aminopeptidase
MIIKNADELNKIKTAAKINTEAIMYAMNITKAGISSLEVDRKVEEFYIKNKVKPAFKGVPGSKFPYPATINFQINNQVVHNIPNAQQIVKEGDLVSIDTGCIYEGLYADQAISFGIGSISQEDQKLLHVGKYSVEAACEKAIPNSTTGDIGFIQQNIIEMAGFSVVKLLCGHEIGYRLWEKIKIPAFGRPNSGDILKENLVICIENQVCAGTDEVYTDKDGWAILTKDGKNSVTFEHMVIVKKKPEIITRI